MASQSPQQPPTELDALDDLNHFRDEFNIPSCTTLGNLNSSDAEDLERPAIYLCGNSLGLQPKETKNLVLEELQVWAERGVNGHHKHPKSRPWVDIDATVTEEMATIVGALCSEVAVMGTLTANLHFLMAAFYRPTASRYKIIIEDKAFPSDHYAAGSQLAWHGFDPADALITLSPPIGQYTLDTSDILRIIEDNRESTAMILLPGVQYYTGQLFEMEKITKFAKDRGIVIGWDLAHAVGNVELNLHDWNVDFAVWCSYKYLNSGPGAIGGIFVHESQSKRGRLTGWWGHDKATRFTMENEFSAIPGAAGFQHSNPSVLATVCLLGSLRVFSRATMKAIREKSIRLTGYMEKRLLSDQESSEHYTIITPRSYFERGAQLSLLFKGGIMEPVYEKLEAAGIVVDKRQPDVIRVAPAPLTVATSDQILVPETLLKKRKSVEKQKEERASALKQRKAVSKGKRETIFKRAESYVKEYRDAEREKVRLARTAKQDASYYVPAQPKLAFVIRIKGINKIAPKPRKILQLLRLLQINNGVFIKLTKATSEMLRIVEPYIAYGEPNLKSVRELIYKRGYGKIDKQRIPLTDNALIESSLGEYGVVSIEDLIHEIYTVGPNFKQANNFLWPFKLSNPTGGFRARKFKHYVEGGDTGDRETYINQLIRQMN
ncbi:hypothetical protein DRE_07154 [Drechslerella stenobrocha 248]|uniref:Kynureninase n=1 Tax=Drechslerella stenobrocha 248 TaxID=1043628 RepID=W7HVM5_9PEZI|nr:hypothetical protein DRE_07154 [Drechslerella stenobrocha 248]